MPRPAGILRFIGGHIRGRIIAGLLILLPLGATYLIIKFVFDLIDPPPGAVDCRDYRQAHPGSGLGHLLGGAVCGGHGGKLCNREKAYPLRALARRPNPHISLHLQCGQADRRRPGIVEHRHRANRVVLLDFPSKGIKSIGSPRPPSGTRMAEKWWRFTFRRRPCPRPATWR